MKKYIVLDSNIIVSFFEGGFSLVQQKGEISSSEEISIFEFLYTALEANQLDLILPEVVILECERIKEEMKESLSKLYDSAFKSAKEASIPPNKKISSSSIDKINRVYDSTRDEAIQNIEYAWGVFNKISESKNTHIVPLDEEILLNAYRRGLMGKRPFVMRYSNSKDPDLSNKPIHDIQPDCVIVESVKFFIKGAEKGELYLATNDNNFFSSMEKTAIHTDIQAELKANKFYLALSDLLQDVLGLKIPPKKEPKDVTTSDAYPVTIKSVTDEGKGVDTVEVAKG